MPSAPRSKCAHRTIRQTVRVARSQNKYRRNLAQTHTCIHSLFCPTTPIGSTTFPLSDHGNPKQARATHHTQGAKYMQNTSPTSAKRCTTIVTNVPGIRQLSHRRFFLCPTPPLSLPLPPCSTPKMLRRISPRSEASCTPSLSFRRRESAVGAHRTWTGSCCGEREYRKMQYHRSVSNARTKI